jgi:hypothetical protein
MYIAVLEKLMETAYKADKAEIFAQETKQYYKIAADALSKNNIPFEVERMSEVKKLADKQIKEIEAEYLMNRLVMTTIADPDQTFMKMLKKKIASDPKTLEAITNPEKLQNMFKDIPFSKPVDENDVENILRQINEDT